MFARVLVPTDFSPPSTAALAHARVLIGAFEGGLHVLHVLPSAFLRAVAGDPRAIETGAIAEAREWLGAAGERAAAVAVVRSDAPADEIVRVARTSEIDLIVMGTHGRSGMAHLLMGSVAERVVRTAPCPVLTVQAPPPSASGGVKRILVPTDFSASADAALEVARVVAGRFGAAIHLLHVLAETLEGGAEVFVSDPPEARTVRLRDAIERLGHRITDADRARYQARTEAIFGTPAEGIVDYAGHEFDLIVMGTHGRTGLAHALMGSVAERVVRHAACPVITLRQTPGAGARYAATAPTAASEGRTSRSGSGPGRG